VKGLAAAALLSLALLLPAGVRAGTEEEIAHLLQYVGQSGCPFVRNGREHNASEAREHIAKKYGYVKHRVQRAEDFIEYAATKSSLTGKSYLVLCEGREVQTAEWLRAELARFRQP